MHALHVLDRVGPDEALALARLIAALGPASRHTVAAATPVPGDLRRTIGATAFAIAFPPLSGKASFTRLRRIGGALAGFDLILTHGYDVIDAAMAHTLFGQRLGLPPLVHHETRIDRARSRRRDWYRRLALGRASAVIVPTERLRTIALRDWQQPSPRVHLIPPGADIAAFARKPRADALPRLIKRKGERWLGVMGTCSDELFDAFAALAEAWQMIWFGEGPARETLRARATDREIAHRVHTPGAVGSVNMVDALSLLDLIAFTDQSPTLDTIVAAMAAGLAIAASPTDELTNLLTAENVAELGSTIERFAADDVLRGGIGVANRDKARSRYALDATLAARIAIYRDSEDRGR